MNQIEAHLHIDHTIGGDRFLQHRGQAPAQFRGKDCVAVILGQHRQPQQNMAVMEISDPMRAPLARPRRRIHGTDGSFDAAQRIDSGKGLIGSEKKIGLWHGVGVGVGVRRLQNERASVAPATAHPTGTEDAQEARGTGVNGITPCLKNGIKF